MRRAPSLVAFGVCLLTGPTGHASNEPVLELSRMTFVVSRALQTQLLLEAQEVRIPRDSDLAYLVGVHARVSGDGEGGFEMTCERAEYDLETQDFVAIGKVRGRTAGGRQFFTSRLRYDHARGLASTEVPVTIIDQQGRYQGGGFRYHVDDGRFQLVGGASVVQQ